MAKYSIRKVQSNDDNGYMGEIVTVTDLKNYLQIEGTAYDVPLARFITSARQMIERYCNVSLYGKSYRVQIRVPQYGNPFPLPFPPIDEVSQVIWKKCPSTSVQLTQGTDWNFVDDDASEKEILSNKAGMGNNGMKGLHIVEYTTMADESSIYQQAILAQAAYSFNNRDSDKDIGIAPEVKGIVAASRNHAY